SSGAANEVLTHFLDVASLFDSVFAAGRVGEGSARLVVGGVIQTESVAKVVPVSTPPNYAAPNSAAAVSVAPAR
ncbi:MAG TPA: hypothetical protein VGP63_23285, partial [Planctomycetaceae bacterium]|nr:hypothetical protein [Planctomycetaceae bacterium]